jgi:hypothetical protein
VFVGRGVFNCVVKAENSSKNLTDSRCVVAKLSAPFPPDLDTRERR